MFAKKLSLLLLGVVLMSFEGVIIKISGKDSLSFGAVFGLCFMLANLALLLRGGWAQALNNMRAGGRALWLAGLAMGLSNLSFFTAVKHSGIALPVLVLAATPVLCALMSKAFLGISTPKSVFVAAGVVGLGLIFIVKDELSLGWDGLLASLFCLLCYSTLFVVWASKDGVSAEATAVLGGAVLALLGGLSAGFSLSQGELAATMFMGLVLTPLARLFMRAGALGLAPALVGLVVILESVFAPLFAWLILGELPSSGTFVGGAIILLAVFANSFYLAKASKP